MSIKKYKIAKQIAGEYEEILFESDNPELTQDLLDIFKFHYENEIVKVKLI